MNATITEAEASLLAALAKTADAYGDREPEYIAVKREDVKAIVAECQRLRREVERTDDVLWDRQRVWDAEVNP